MNNTKITIKNMKQRMKILTLIVSLGLLIGLSVSGLAQNPPPPPGQHNLNGDQPPQGGNAPLGGGLVLLLGMGIGYAVKRIADNRK
jgi:hypothetical protein